MNTVAFDRICPLTTTRVTTPASAENTSLTPLEGNQEEYTVVETEAAAKIQRLWRKYSSEIKIRRLYLELPEAQAVAHFISLSATCPTTLTFTDGITFRHTLISKGVTMSLRVTVARETLSKLQQEAMNCIEKDEIIPELFESVDDALHRNNHVEALLKEVDERMSDQCIIGVVKTGVLTELETAMEAISRVLAEAEGEMLQTREAIDRVSRSCT